MPHFFVSRQSVFTAYVVVLFFSPILGVLLAVVPNVIPGIAPAGPFQGIVFVVIPFVVVILFALAMVVPLSLFEQANKVDDSLAASLTVLLAMVSPFLVFYGVSYALTEGMLFALIGILAVAALIATGYHGVLRRARPSFVPTSFQAV